MPTGSGPAFLWQPVSREIKGAETHGSAPSGLGAEEDSAVVGTLLWINYTLFLPVYWIIINVIMYMYVCVQKWGAWQAACE